MKRQEYTYMHECNKNGIRIYPIVKYGSYFLVVEFNRTHEFFPHEIIGAPKVGEVRYDPNKPEWSEKMLELYAHLYQTKIAPKSKVA